MGKTMNKKINFGESATPSAITTTPPISSEGKSAARDKLQKFYKEEMRLVKGLFQNFETPGGSLRLQVRKYKEHFFDKVMEDGQEYEVPLYVARHLNGIDATAEAIDGKVGTCSYPVSSYLMDASGTPIISHAKRKKRFGFQSLEFAASAA